MASSTRPDEFDTADRHGGQVGGLRMGVNYRLATMRCGSGQVLVGVNIRRGDTLNYVEITCAAPSCVNGSCTWSSPRRGMSAGNPGGGEAHPAMMCRSNEIVSGIRGRAVVFAERPGFDYASDIEIECSQMASPAVTGPAGDPFYPVARGSAASWHHPDGGFSAAPPGGSLAVSEDSITGPISCGYGGYGATAVSVGVSYFRSGEPAVQAVSLYCPRIAPTSPQQRLPNVASTAGRKQRSGTTPPAAQKPSLDFGTAVAGAQNASNNASATQQLSQAAGNASFAANDFRLMTPEDPMWSNRNYAGTLGYFPGRSSTLSSCHGFIGEMGVATPGANLCGDGYMQNLPHLSRGTPHQLGDVAVVYDRFAKAPFNWHSAIFIGCSLYLQRNNGSDVQVIRQSYIDNFMSNEQVAYVRPIGLGTFPAKLAALKARINTNEGTSAEGQATLTQIKGCF